MSRVPLKNLVHSRVTPTVPIALDQIRGNPNFVEDPQFTKLFVSMMKGEGPLALSRLSQSKITGGFYRWIAGAPELVQSVDEEGVRTTMAYIRQGHRPALYLYWSRVNPKPDKFVCADDENVLEAYRRLNIQRVPVRIMAPKAERLEEGAILIGSNKRRFWGSRAPKKSHYEASFEPPTPALSVVCSTSLNFDLL